MRFNLYRLLPILLFMNILASCQEEKEPIPDISQKDAYELFQKKQRHNNMSTLVQNLTYADLTANGNQQPAMRYGVRLDMTNPTIYTVGVENYEEAEKLFRSSIIPSWLDSLYTQDETCLMDFGEYGSASFQKNKNGGPLLAMLEIALDSIPQITLLRFVRKDALPEDNDRKTFTRGQIVADKYDSNRKYICVSSINQGNPCRLICFNRPFDVMVTRFHNTSVFHNCIDEGMAKSLRAFINESTPLWEKSERVFFLKYDYKRTQYSKRGETLYWSGGHKPPFRNNTKDVKWILNTVCQEASSGWWLWEKTWGNFTFRWFDYNTSLITSVGSNNENNPVSYDMPESIAMSGVALDVINEKRWILVDNITPANYKTYPEY